ncbi:FliH/SctL family protein [Granulosicoccus antarcticus]|uniref:Flagellar assembly protein FliH n=1 Tax=Granulosicoccus antarcticus IMCC3135 TaxID=1192854 RepID=A0A2Z2NMN6_9GAMM|nr:FliH/SctL family protein [Granulosicoccus antarcticus]ASJ71775.1 hypothetical protein IMCC3135_08380 [Granulosicoccus antarcticus IMCC3135]
MFRVLSEDESKNVVRWQAPDLKGTVPVANTRQVATPVRLSETMAASDLLREVNAKRAGGQPEFQQASQGGAAAGNPGRQSGSLPLTNPSAGMLQNSYDEGHAHGYAEGNAALHQESVKQLQTLVDSLGKPALQVPDRMLEQEVIGLAMDIAKMLVKREVEIDPEALASLVRAGMEQLPHAAKSDVSVHLHPMDANVLRELTIQPEGVEFKDDVNLQRGDCRIVSNASTVHCGVDNWLEVMGAELGLLPVPVAQD